MSTRFMAVLRLVLCTSAFAISASSAWSQGETVFSGLPLVKAVELGVSRAGEEVPTATAAGLACVITKAGGKYLWATRENKEMLRHVSGSS